MIKLDKTYFDKLYNIKHDEKQISEIIEHCRNEMESGDVGFYTLPEKMKPVLVEIKAYIASLPKEIDTFLLIGVGGSALGPQTIDQAFRTHKTKNKFICLDNTDPDVLTDILETIDPKKTLVNVISKSGGTLETMANFSIIHEKFKSILGEDVYKNYVFTTDPLKSSLKDYAGDHNVQCFYIPSNVGGRFSVLSPVGLLMSEFMGYNSEKLLSGADELVKQFFDSQKNNNYSVAMDYALSKYYAYKNENKTVSVLMPYSSKLGKFSAWYKQLWGESLGKRFDLDGREIFTGQTPVQAIGSIDQHSILQYLIEGQNVNFVSFIKVKSRRKINTEKLSLLKPNFINIDLGKINNDQLDSSAEALVNENRSNITVELEKLDENHIGMLFLTFELSAAIWGKILGINPYDQPGVELGKKIIEIKYMK